MVALSRTSIALLMKFVITFIFASISFIFLAGNTWGWIVLVALLVTAINYIAGDLFILPKFGNSVASVADGLMGALIAYVVALMAVGFNTTFATLVYFIVLTTIGEYFFHIYLLNSDKVAP